MSCGRYGGVGLREPADQAQGGQAVWASGDLPEAIIAFLDSSSFEDALRNAISLGGDSDTQACIAGGIAEAYYKDVPLDTLRQVKERLSTDLWEETREFYRRYGIREILKQVDEIGVP